MKKICLSIFLVFLLLIAGCTQEQPKKQEATIKTCPTCPSPGEWSECLDGQQKRTNYQCDLSTSYECKSFVESESCATPEPEKNQTVPEKPKPAEAIKEFNITAKQFEFIPSTITVNKGDKVRIRVKSIDVTHGFSIPGLNVNEQLGPNTTVIVEFTAFEVATYDFMCNVFCGSGHPGMKGQIIVLDKN
ncbi:cupredoxin domain-containing protein [Candidatus Micrarchaeota archaeon]|nr:cupredoxin domain-containing protein [Candidatus Micrarchaeota archaeon]